MRTYNIGDTRRTVREFARGWHQVKGERWVELDRAMMIPVIEQLTAPDQSWQDPKWKDYEVLVDEATEVPAPTPRIKTPSWLTRLWRRLFLAPILPPARALPDTTEKGSP